MDATVSDLFMAELLDQFSRFERRWMIEGIVCVQPCFKCESETQSPRLS